MKLLNYIIIWYNQSYYNMMWLVYVTETAKIKHVSANYTELYFC